MPPNQIYWSRAAAGGTVLLPVGRARPPESFYVPTKRHSMCNKYGEGTMTTQIFASGVFFILAGLVVWLFGYGIWRILLALTGAVYGFVIGTTLVEPVQGLPSVVFGIAGAILLALLAYFLWSVAALIYGMFLGVGLGVWAARLSNAPESTQTMTVFVIAGAIAGIVLAYFLKDQVIMLATALSGAAAILYGAQMTMPGAARLTTGNNAVLGFFIWVVGGLLGYAIQNSIFNRRLTGSLGGYRRAA